MGISLKGAAATLTAAAVLAVGVDYATFAANGHSLILGNVNHERTTTTVVKKGPGPALSLRSAGNTRPSLKVSSSARVRRLNADRLDGKNASALASNAVTFKAGSRGAVFTNLTVWRLPVRPGIYQASFAAFVFAQSATPDQPVDVICGLADINTLGTETPHVYTAQSAFAGGGAPALVSGAETVRVRASENPGLVCAITSEGEFTLAQPVTASWTRVNSQRIRRAQPFTPPAAARKGLLQQFDR